MSKEGNPDQLPHSSTKEAADFLPDWHGVAGGEPPPGKRPQLPTVVEDIDLADNRGIHTIQGR
jgi:hypothetical protein